MAAFRQHTYHPKRNIQVAGELQKSKSACQRTLRTPRIVAELLVHLVTLPGQIGVISSSPVVRAVHAPTSDGAGHPPVVAVQVICEAGLGIPVGYVEQSK